MFDWFSGILGVPENCLNRYATPASMEDAKAQAEAMRNVANDPEWIALQGRLLAAALRPPSGPSGIHWRRVTNREQLAEIVR